MLTKEQIDNLPSRYVKKLSHLPYYLAKEAVNNLAPHITSKRQYRKWVKDSKSYFMPLFPEDVYPDFKWGEFLETYEPGPNMVEKYIRRKKREKNYLPVWEAVRWAQKYCRANGITTWREWISHCRETKIPDYIPRDPRHAYYDDWPGSKVWCGVTVEGIQEAEIKVIPVLTLLHPVKTPDNVLELVRWANGVGDLRQKWREQTNYDRIIGCWVMERELLPEVERILSENGSSNGAYWTIPNIHQLTWELNSLLEMVKL